MNGALGWVFRFARRSPGAGTYLMFRWIGFRGFRRLAAELPSEGPILDMGCGHGLLTLLIAADDRRREVLGIDVLEGRLAVGRQVAATSGLTNVTFEERDFSDLPAGRFAAIVFSDVLLYYPIEKQKRILDDCRDRLLPGGVLVVKEQGRRPGWKAFLVRLQERLVVSLKTTLGGSRTWRRIAPEGVHLWQVERLKEFLRSRGLSVGEEPIDEWSYLSHYLVVARDSRRSQADLFDTSPA